MLGLHNRAIVYDKLSFYCGKQPPSQGTQDKQACSSVIVKKYPTTVKITKQQFLTITKYFKPIN
jgi:hypothetical protein